MKKGISLLEILISIAVIAFLTQKAFYYKKEKDFLSEIDNMIVQIGSIVSIGVYDTFKGYTTAGGGDCSTAYDVINISAKRIKLCSKIPYTMIDNTTGDDTDSAKSYFSFLDAYSRTATGCSVYIEDFDDTTTRFLINCSGLDIKYYSMLEQKVPKQISKQLSLIYKTNYPKAIDFTNTTSGTETDGIFILEFQK